MSCCASSAYCALRHAAPSRHFLSPNLPHGTHFTARCGQSSGCAKPHFLFAQRLASRHFFSPKAPHGTQAIGVLVTCCSSGGQLRGCAKPHFAFAHDKPSRHLLLPNLPHSTQGGWRNVQSGREQRSAKRQSAVGAMGRGATRPPVEEREKDWTADEVDAACALCNAGGHTASTPSPFPRPPTYMDASRECANCHE